MGSTSFKNITIGIYTNTCEVFLKHAHSEPFIIKLIKPNYSIYVSTVKIRAFCTAGELKL